MECSDDQHLRKGWSNMGRRRSWTAPESQLRFQSTLWGSRAFPVVPSPAEKIRSYSHGFIIASGLSRKQDLPQAIPKLQCVHGIEGRFICWEYKEELAVGSMVSDLRRIRIFEIILEKNEKGIWLGKHSGIDKQQPGLILGRQAWIQAPC